MANIIEKTAVSHSVNGDPALLHISTRKPSCRWQTHTTRKHAKIAPIWRAYNFVADNTGPVLKITGLSSFL